MRKIPFLDLVTPHLELEEELVGVFRTAIRSAAFIGGPSVERFEQDFARFCDSPHSVAVASGTDAVLFALIAAGVRPGETVVTVPNTFIATTEAISQAGATPEFVDVDERTYTMSPEALRTYLEKQCTADPASGRLVSRRTGQPVSAIVPVHLYGQLADMDPIMELARQYRLIVVEDACQAHGAEYYSAKESRWRKAGSIGDAAAFSFYPGKNLGACGEGGAVTTGDGRMARVCRMLRDHGQSKKYHHDLEGWNGRLDAIQAGILCVKLGHLARWNRQRQACAKIYDDLLATAATGPAAPFVPRWSRPVYHLYVVRVAERAPVMAALDAQGIGTGIHYPVPLHLATPYLKLGYQQGDLPVAERAAAEVLSLPMYPNLDHEAQRMVIAALVQATVPRYTEAGR